MCGDCGHCLEVTLTFEQWNDPAPTCPECARREMAQDIKPVAIGGSVRAKAVKLAETIAAEDYGVADMKIEGKEGVRNKVRYRDDKRPRPEHWGVSNEALQTAIALGRQTRQQYGGDGLDMLQRALKSGDQPDLIELSKKRSARIW